MAMDEIVCNCMNVTKRMIKEAVDSGAVTLEDVQNVTSAGTACGGCIDSIQQLIDEFTSAK